MSINISDEEKFLINLLFSENVKKISSLKKIDFENLVKIASSHLMLPSLYVNIKKKKYMKFIPDELKIYLKEIHRLNKERNKILLKEIKEISKILNFNKIEHVFLKGSAHIISDLYDDIGERMVGDIDILTCQYKSKLAVKILKENGYGPKPKRNFLLNENKHYLRQTKQDKIFAIEIHKKLLVGNNLKYIDIFSFIKNKKFVNGVYIPNLNNQLKHNIYNYQINDYGSTKLSYSYRSFYDSYMIIKKGKIKLSSFKFNKHFNKYFTIAKELNISNLRRSKLKKNMIDVYRFKNKYSNKLFFYFDNLISSQFIKMKSRPKQIVELITNKNYRKYLFIKIFKKAS